MAANGNGNGHGHANGHANSHVALALGAAAIAKLAVRFEKSVRREGGHVLWTGDVHRKEAPWPRLTLNGRSVSAYKLSFLLQGGTLLAGQHAFRVCDVPLCVGHVSLARPRHQYGVIARRGPRLLPRQVRQLRKAYTMKGDGLVIRDYAAKLGVAPSTISRVVRGLTWRSVQ